MDECQLVEINLISAQELKKPGPTNLRRLETYAVGWVDPTAKVRTRVDRVGAENPTWNDKLIFRVPSSALSRDSSTAVSIHIYAVGRLTDTFLGSVRLLLSNLSLSPSSPSPSFAALQIRRPSGRFHGVLNVGAVLLPTDSLRPSVSAAGFLQLSGENLPPRYPRRPGHDSPRSSFFSASASSSPADPSFSPDYALKDWNRRSVTQSPDRASRILCGLGFQRKIHVSLSDRNLRSCLPLDEKN